MTAQLYNLGVYRRTRQLGGVAPNCSRQLVSNQKVPPDALQMARAKARCLEEGWEAFVQTASAYELLQYAYALEAERQPSVREQDERDEYAVLARMFAAEAARPFTLPRDRRQRA